MAGKEDPVRNWSAPAEKLEAEGVELEVGAVPSAFMPRPLGGHKQGEKKAGLMSSLVLSGSHTPTDEERHGEVGLGSGHLMAFSARRALGEKESVTGRKRKAEDSDDAPVAQSSAAEQGGDDAVAADADGKEVAAAAACQSFVDEATGIKFVDMPERYLCWILARKRFSPPPYDPRECKWLSPEQIERELESMRIIKASLEGVKDEFFAFQAWVRETYETKGRVLVPEGSIPEAFMD